MTRIGTVCSTTSSSGIVEYSIRLSILLLWHWSNERNIDLVKICEVIELEDSMVNWVSTLLTARDRNRSSQHSPHGEEIQPGSSTSTRWGTLLPYPRGKWEDHTLLIHISNSFTQNDHLAWRVPRIRV